MDEKLFKVGLSIQAGSSHVVQLKKSRKIRETSPSALRFSSNNPSRGKGENGFSLVKKRRVDGAVGLPSDGEACREVIRPLMIDIAALNSDREIRPLKIPIPEEVLRYACIGRQRAKEVMIRKMDVESQFDSALDDWNIEFVKLAECRAELVTISTTLSLQNQEADRSHTELIEARTETNQKSEVLKALTAEKSALEIANKELQDHLLEKEEAILDFDARIEAILQEAVEKFKKSSAYRREIQNRIQEAYNHPTVTRPLPNSPN
ncbi:hypothetical protein IEQ34_021886 [Dendrobium chrysotoxum]|uniref:Uncharacterized protein n=1 Tax=Dendrobium chrysotoxum TaxID=161865 RepID=A0AAV7FW80_DENCH|nr:hypothetical protein IEQ34_021886 [Dendrobium chrysotoxum]